MSTISKPLSQSWLSHCAVEAIVCHWTAGTREVSNLDLADYHFIIDGNCKVHRGDHPIIDNVPPLRSGRYAAHCRSFNAYEGKAVIGVSVCGMAGARSFPSFVAGPYPITREQIEMQALVVAQLCIEYNLPVTPQTVLQHGEVQKNRGKLQLGKWDVCRWPWAPEMTSAQVCDAFRALVSAKITALRAADAPPSVKLYIRATGVTWSALVEGAIFVNGRWMAPGTAVETALRNFSKDTKPVTSLLASVRQHIEDAGFNVDDVATRLCNFTHDKNNPRQIIVLEAIKNAH